MKSAANQSNSEPLSYAPTIFRKHMQFCVQRFSPIGQIWGKVVFTRCACIPGSFRARRTTANKFKSTVFSPRVWNCLLQAASRSRLKGIYANECVNCLLYTKVKTCKQYTWVGWFHSNMQVLEQLWFKLNRIKITAFFSKCVFKCNWIA